ncbi:MAG: VCBS repeat-containing protein [Aridibacter famidurans]|nr:VCBS repeat-containing protein [Aridibacter famidurans]
MKVMQMFRLASASFAILLFASFVHPQVTFDLPTPAGSQDFGSQVYVLPNGNIVVTDSSFDDPGGAQNVGAVHLFNGRTGALISTMTGSSENDEIGGNDILILPNGNFVVGTYSFDDAGTQDVGSVTLCSGTTGCPSQITFLNSLVGGSTEDSIGSNLNVLPNGNFVVLADSWDNGGEQDVGAVIFCSGITGCTGNVTQANALIGTTADDRVGREIFVLSDGDFVISSRFWDAKGGANAGAVTHCSGTAGCPLGAVSSANSLVGSSANDEIGRSGITPLGNGNYVVASNLWNGAATDTGAATFCLGDGSCIGEVSAANSLVGTATSDQVGNAGAFLLANGHYVVGSRFWDTPDDLDAGAVTWCDGNTGCTGPVTIDNSLYGTSFGDNVGFVIPLANGNYVAMSLSWNSATASNAGAATFCLGNGTCTGPVTTANSMVGATASDVVGNSGMALSNGNYLLLSRNWDNGAANEAGAVTLCSGTIGCIGVVGPGNSLVGTNANDVIGNEAYELANGNVVIVSEFANTGGVAGGGAVTFCTGIAGGCPVGAVSSSNSLIGSTANDRVGGSGLLTLSNGSYVVLSRDWDNGGATNAGAATICNGVGGCSGTIGAANSLIGTSANDNVAEDGVVSGSRYLIKSSRWDNGGVVDAGAITSCGPEGCFGPVSASNSIVGTTAGDDLGNRGLAHLPNGDFIIGSDNWSQPQSSNLGTPGQNVGAVTYVDLTSGSTGPIPQNTSVIGTIPTGGNSMRFVYDPVFKQVVVGHSSADRVAVLRPLACPGGNVIVDRDCDGRTDVSVFRPSSGVWYFASSTDGFSAIKFGISTDVPVPRDFDGDGNVDVAIFRATAAPDQPDFYILPSGGGPVMAAQWGVPGDIPVGLDYDGDGKDDISVFRPSNGTWYILQSSDGQAQVHQFGVSGDIPLVMDFNGDGKDDLAVYRPGEGTWYIARPTGIPNQNFDAVPFGLSNDIPVPADYDGDGQVDIAVFRPSNGGWYLLQSTVGVQIIAWGGPGDIPVPGDYDGDSIGDIAIFRNGEWWQRLSTGGWRVDTFGVAGDKPLPARQ